MFIREGRIYNICLYGHRHYMTLLDKAEYIIYVCMVIDII